MILQKIPIQEIMAWCMFKRSAKRVSDSYSCQTLKISQVGHNDLDNNVNDLNLCMQLGIYPSFLQPLRIAS